MFAECPVNLAPPTFPQFFISDDEDTIDPFIEVIVVTTTVDEPPSFARDSYSFSIREDTADGTELGDLDVTDDGEAGTAAQLNRVWLGPVCVGGSCQFMAIFVPLRGSSEYGNIVVNNEIHLHRCIPHSPL